MWTTSNWSVLMKNRYLPDKSKQSRKKCVEARHGLVVYGVTLKTDPPKSGQERVCNCKQDRCESRPRTRNGFIEIKGALNAFELRCNMY